MLLIRIRDETSHRGSHSSPGCLERPGRAPVRAVLSPRATPGAVGALSRGGCSWVSLPISCLSLPQVSMQNAMLRRCECGSQQGSGPMGASGRKHPEAGTWRLRRPQGPCPPWRRPATAPGAEASCHMLRSHVGLFDVSRFCKSAFCFSKRGIIAPRFVNLK